MPAGFEGFEGLRLHDSPLCQSPWVCTVAAGRERSPPHNESDDTQVVDTVRLIFKPEVLHRVGLSFPTIWKVMRQGRFALARITGGKSAWIESEINDFLAGLPLRRYKSDLSPDAEGDKKKRALMTHKAKSNSNSISAATTRFSAIC